MVLVSRAMGGLVSTAHLEETETLSHCLVLPRGTAAHSYRCRVKLSRVDHSLTCTVRLASIKLDRGEEANEALEFSRSGDSRFQQ